MRLFSLFTNQTSISACCERKKRKVPALWERRKFCKTMILAELESICSTVQKRCFHSQRTSWDTCDVTIKKHNKKVARGIKYLSFLTKIWNTRKSLHVIKEMFIEYLRQLSAWCAKLCEILTVQASDWAARRFHSTIISGLSVRFAKMEKTNNATNVTSWISLDFHVTVLLTVSSFSATRLFSVW